MYNWQLTLKKSLSRVSLRVGGLDTVSQIYSNNVIMINDNSADTRKAT